MRVSELDRAHFLSPPLPTSSIRTLHAPPQTIARGFPSSPSGWFASGKSTEGGFESYTPSYHARSTTAVDGASGACAWFWSVGVQCSAGSLSDINGEAWT